MKRDKTKSPIELDWAVRGSKVVFLDPDGGEVFSMEGERWGWLLNSDFVRSQLQEAAQERLYPSSWGLREYVQIARLLRKDLAIADISRLWGVPDTVVRTFYGRSLQQFQHDADLVRQEGARQASEEGEQDFCRSVKRGESRSGEHEGPGHDHLSVLQVARLLKEHHGIPLAVSSELMLDADDFRRWLDANQKYIDLF